MLVPQGFPLHSLCCWFVDEFYTQTGWVGILTYHLLGYLCDLGDPGPASGYAWMEGLPQATGPTKIKDCLWRTCYAGQMAMMTMARAKGKPAIGLHKDGAGCPERWCAGPALMLRGYLTH